LIDTFSSLRRVLYDSLDNSFDHRSPMSAKNIVVVDQLVVRVGKLRTPRHSGPLSVQTMATRRARSHQSPLGLDRRSLQMLIPVGPFTSSRSMYVTVRNKL
jgi:hypothetical protein